MKFTKTLTVFLASALLLALETTAEFQGVRGVKTRALQGGGKDKNKDKSVSEDEVVVEETEVTEDTTGTATEGEDTAVTPPTGTGPRPDTGTGPVSMTGSDIVINAMMTPELSSLVRLLVAGNLVTTLTGPGPFTVFAPVNSAFPNGADLSQLENDPALRSILQYHVVPGIVMSSDLTDGMTATTAQGSDLTIGVSPTGVMINDANVLYPDLVTSNGIVHLIDAVLIPTSSGPSSPVTPASNITTLPSNVTTPGTPSTLPEVGPPAMPGSTVVDLAMANTDLTTLVDLVVMAQLVETLMGPGPFTVFAPTNEAFAAVDATTFASLAADPMGALTDVLLYHVVPGTVLAGDLQNGQMVETVAGTYLTVDLSNGAMINDATVTATDVMGSNGVVHIIDTVLTPPAAIQEDAGMDHDETMGMPQDMEIERASGGF